MNQEIKYLKIKDDLFINMMPVNVNKKVENEIEESQNHFWIFDRSGSMSGYLDEVVESAIEYCSTLSDGSTVSVGYFSGKDEYNLSVPFVLKKELNNVITTLNSFRHSLSMTNFIQILEKINEVSGKTNNKASLFFFTDGCHNSGGGKKEIEAALKEWNKYAVISMFVGYGYIDRDMMSWMAEITNGSFIHLNNFKDFKTALSDFGDSVEDSNPSIIVPITISEKTIPISLSGKSVIEYTLENNEIKYRPSKKGYKGIFFITKNKMEGAIEINKADMTIEKGIRALAYIYSQKNDANISLELLAYTGDKYLIRKLYDSVTPEEFAQSEKFIRKSVFYPKDRFLEGEVKNYLPDPNAFCVMDAISVIMEDDNCKMYIRDKDFEYNRIGKKVNQTDGAVVTYPDKDNSFVYFNKIVMNKERLNVSISTSMAGHVFLDPDNFKKNPFTINDLKKLGINQSFPVTSFRTYSIIADGKLQTKKIVVSDISKETIKKLNGTVTLRDDGKYIVDFESLPIINKNYVKMTSAKTLAEFVWKEKLLSSRLSLFNYLKKTAENDLGKKILKEKDSMSNEVAEFLLNHCYIKGDSYNPPTQTISGNDQYNAYSFTINIKGFSDVSASDVIKKIREGKKPTLRESLVACAYEQFKVDDLFPEKEGEDFIKRLSMGINILNKELNTVRNYIQMSKFAIIIGNKGKMDEFESRENMSLGLKVMNLNSEELDVDFNFVIKKIVVDI